MAKRFPEAYFNRCWGHIMVRDLLASRSPICVHPMNVCARIQDEIGHAAGKDVPPLLPPPRKDDFTVMLYLRFVYCARHGLAKKGAKLFLDFDLFGAVTSTR